MRPDATKKQERWDGIEMPESDPGTPPLEHTSRRSKQAVFFFLLFPVSRLIHNDRKCRLIVYLLIPHIIHIFIPHPHLLLHWVPTSFRG